MLQAEQANLPRSFVLSAFVFLVAAVCIQGYWLEGRKGAFLLEWGRLGVLFGVTLGMPTLWPESTAAQVLVEPLYVYVGSCAVILLLSYLLPARFGEVSAATQDIQ